MSDEDAILGVPSISSLSRRPSFFPKKEKNTPWGNSWLMKRTMVEKNGESTPGTMAIDSGSSLVSLVPYDL